ncbi:unnamed protein product [Ectocarpus sp. CCAP 1310/34]|nr:unnamed protein product [Ectocarpus sp. CCAP 1310/34]
MIPVSSSRRKNNIGCHRQGLWARGKTLVFYGAVGGIPGLGSVECPRQGLWARGNTLVYYGAVGGISGLFRFLRGRGGSGGSSRAEWYSQ